MLNVRLAGDHLYGKLLSTWLSLVMSLMVSFCAALFPRDVLDEILDLIETVSGGFPSYLRWEGTCLHFDNLMTNKIKFFNFLCYETASSLQEKNLLLEEQIYFLWVYPHCKKDAKNKKA